MGLSGAAWDEHRLPDEVCRASRGKYRITYEHRDWPGDRRCFGYADTWIEVKRAINHLRASEFAWYPKVRVLGECGAMGHRIAGCCDVCGNQMSDTTNYPRA
jgi:hypothetical protein